ncbi:MAG: helix-turn-helix domain-containing protein [Micropepsaceae bacterium]
MTGRTLKEVLATLPPARRKAIERGTKELIQDELSLRELRKAHKLTQVKLAKALNTSQEVISRMEHNSDLLLSTLRNYVEAVGGKLQLTAEFPGKSPVALTGFGELGDGRPKRRTKRTADAKVGA